MPLSTKAIKNRIKSVQNTKKITKAMEMVAASKMKKAVDRSLSSRAYAERALELLAHVSKDKIVKHPLLEPRTGDRTLLVVIAANRGLCGSYNINVYKQLNQYLKEYIAKHVVSTEGLRVVTVGRYAERYARALKLQVVGSFINLPDDMHIDDMSGLTKLVIDDYAAGEYDRVHYVYTDYISAIKGSVTVRKLLPIKTENIAALFSSIGDHKESREAQTESLMQYKFEPDEEEVLDRMLPILTNIQLYQALLESQASEHSARMMAMKNASDNAGELVSELTLTYNKARQASITQEIIEIATAANAIA